MRSYMCLAVLLSALVCLSAPASAQLIMNPSSSCDLGGVELGPAVAFSKTAYKGDDDSKVDVERILTGLYGAWGLNEWFDLYVSFSFIADAQRKPDEGEWDDSGNGFLAGAGIRGINYQNDYIDVMSYVQVSFISEDYGEMEGTKVDAEIFDVALGAIVKGYVTDRLSVYGGVEFIPYTDGKEKFNTKFESTASPEPVVEEEEEEEEEGEEGAVVGAVSGSGSGQEDFERDLPVTIRLGANYEFDGWWLRGEVGLISETSFLLGAGFMF